MSRIEATLCAQIMNKGANQRLKRDLILLSAEYIKDKPEESKMLRIRG
jgi:hypothetical protein